MPLITVLTPTYNRASLLPRLYESLCRQTCKDFEWIVVDDGSTDNTQEVLAQLSTEGNINAKSLHKKNGGKHTAVNLGVKHAKGELSLILDSDDELPTTAIADIKKQWNEVKLGSVSQCEKPIGGVCGYMAHRNGDIIGKPMIDTTCDEMELRYLHGVTGDMCEVFRTDILRENPFPEISGERFCPEVLVWNRIAQKYRLKVFPKMIYIRDYLDGGLTDNIVRIRMRSPIASMMTYAEMLGYAIPWREKVKAAVNYYRFRCCYKLTEQNMGIAIPTMPFPYSLAEPLGWLMHVKDQNNKTE